METHILHCQQANTAWSEFKDKQSDTFRHKRGGIIIGCQVSFDSFAAQRPPLYRPKKLLQLGQE
jgi:predicted nucleotidyltransferase